MNKFKICINDSCFRITASHKSIEDIIKEKYSETPSGNKRRRTFHLKVKYGSIDRAKFKNSKENKAIIKDLGNKYKISSNFFEAIIYWQDKKAALIMLPEPGRASLSIENFFRIFCSLNLLNSNGFLLHCAASVCAGKALLFCGQSGAGKSTLANLLKKKMKILTDDIIAVRQINNKWFVQAVPFRLWDKKLINKLYPIAAIFELRKAKTFSITPLAFIHRVSLLMSVTPFLPDSKRICYDLLDKAELIAKKIPFYGLGFPKKSIPFRQLVSLIK